MPHSLLQRFSFLPRYLLLILITACPLFFIGGPDWVSAPWLRALWDLGHIAFFAVLIFVAHFFVNLQRPRVWLLITLCVFLIGVAIEWAQNFLGRDACWQDVWRNLVGVWLGLFWGQKPTLYVWRLRVLSLLLVMPNLWPMGEALWLQFYTARQFPLLTSFENKWDLERAHGRVFLSKEQHADGESSLKVILDNEAYSGTGIHYLLGDWRDHEYLAMELFNPDLLPLNMVVRITDKQHDRGKHDYDDRFNMPIMLQTGWNKIRIPLTDIAQAPRNRQLNMGEINRIDVFVSGFAPGRVFYWDYVRLER